MFGPLCHLCHCHCTIFGTSGTHVGWYRAFLTFLWSFEWKSICQDALKMTTDDQSSNQLLNSITNLHLVAKQNLRGFLSRLPFPRWLGSLLWSSPLQTTKFSKVQMELENVKLFTGMNLPKFDMRKAHELWQFCHSSKLIENVHLGIKIEEKLLLSMQLRNTS